MACKDIQVREASVSDAASMASVIERANAERDGIAPPFSIQDPGTISDIEEKMNSPKSWAYVACAGSLVTGLVLGYPATESGYAVDDPEAEYLSLLMVDPSNWGQGVASRLVDTALSIVVIRGSVRSFSGLEKTTTCAQDHFMNTKAFM